MKIGFIGLGKLGLPCAVAAAMKGHDVMAYDIVPALMNKNPRAYRETGADSVEGFRKVLLGLLDPTERAIVDKRVRGNR